MLSEEDAFILYVLKSALPTLSHADSQHFLSIAAGKIPSAATISREHKQLALSRKRVENVSCDRDEEDRTAFLTNPPDHGSRPGVFGVPVGMLVSIDEKTIKFGELLKQFGHAPVGLPCVRRGPAPSSQKSYNVITAVDVNVGVVAYLIYQGTLNQDTFYAWVSLQVLWSFRCFGVSILRASTDLGPGCCLLCPCQLLPALKGTGPRVALADNHSAHHTAAMMALFNANGHLLIRGPIHSPDLAPAEWSFSHATKFTQMFEAWLLQHPKEYAQVFAAGLRSITPEYMQVYFADAHFFVPGLSYKPYLGV